MNSDRIRLEASWKDALKEEFEKPYWKELSAFVHNEYLNGTIHPSPKDIFQAFDLCPFDEVKVVILGQDPYHGPGQANGLCFAVHEDIALPPSLKNIFKEIEDDLRIKPENNGDLSRWSRQGVLLLNATLTVRTHSPGSHQDKGWESFTDAAIKKLSDDCENLVFILWGNYAKNKGVVIDRSKHLILTSPHPSPFSAYNGFFGSKHFSQANKYLKENGNGEVDWR